MTIQQRYHHKEINLIKTNIKYNLIVHNINTINGSAFFTFYDLDNNFVCNTDNIVIEQTGKRIDVSDIGHSDKLYILSICKEFKTYFTSETIKKK